MPYVVVVPDNLNPEGLAVLQAQPELTIVAGGVMTRAQTLEAVREADALIIRSSTQVDAELLNAAPRLKIVARAGVGVDNVDLNACTARGIVVMNTPDGNTVSTAEHTFGLLLALVRHIPQADASLRAGRWDRKQFAGIELRGKTLGIIGFGRVGRAVAQRAGAFGMTVIAYDPFVPPDVARHLGLSMSGTLDELLARADIITLHAQVTPDTRGLINAATIAKMKDGVYLINAARGALIVNEDLAAALRSGKVAGAAFDVYDEEPPPPDHPLLGLANAVYTPHIAASTEEAQSIVGVQAAQEVIDALFKGEYEIANVRNKAVLEQLKRQGE